MAANFCGGGATKKPSRLGVFFEQMAAILGFIFFHWCSFAFNLSFALRGKHSVLICKD
jgi:hypothetical protein